MRAEDFAFPNPDPPERLTEARSPAHDPERTHPVRTDPKPSGARQMSESQPPIRISPFVLHPGDPRHGMTRPDHRTGLSARNQNDHPTTRTEAGTGRAGRGPSIGLWDMLEVI